jgi:phosphoserine phosphatase RsbU/P
MGHEVVVTADGLQAWNQLRDRPERLVISDWMMPVMSGLELCRKIRAEIKWPICSAARAETAIAPPA